MADTTINPALVPKYWAKDTWAAGFEGAFFHKFMGEGARNIIQVRTELLKGKGDTIIFNLLMPLKGAGIKGDDWLEGNEETLTYLDFRVTIDQLRNAIRLKGQFEEQKAQVNMRKNAKEALAQWMSRTVDDMIFSALTENPSSDRVVYAGGVTAENAITASDTFSAKMIGVAKRIATENRDLMINPVRINGRDTYAMVIDQWQARDLQQDPEWREAQLHANIDGKDNPIFTGALGMYDGVVIHMHNGIKRTETGANGIMVGHALFLGAQAAVFAIGKEPTWHEDTFDYGNKWGAEFGRIFGIAKTQFKFDGVNDTDFGVVNVLTSSVTDRQ